MTVLVVAPITAEFEALAGAFDERWGSPVLRDTGRVSMREYAAAGVVLAEGGFGKVQFGVRTQHLLDHLPEVSLVVCAGIAGGLTGAVRVGDVVIGTATVEHDFHSSVLGPAPPHFDGSREHLAVLASALDEVDGSFRVHFAPIASGDEGIFSRVRKEAVHARTEAPAVAFEGAGGARAALFSGVAYLEVRGISDMAEGDIITELEANLPGVMANVAEVVIRLVDA